MKRRIVSIICIMFLLFTATTPLSGGVFSYADSDGLDDQQKAALAVSVYFNYRNGWYVGSTAGAVSIMKSYIDDFFTDSLNTSDIKSYSDFASHVTVAKNTSGNWAVEIDNTGLVFLDHLVKWLLGKNKFPNIKNGDTWGDGGHTYDDIYRGLISEGSLFFIISNYSSDTVGGYCNISEQYVEPGTAVRGISGHMMLQSYCQALNITLTQFLNKSNANVDLGVYDHNFSYPVQYFSDVTIGIGLSRWSYPSSGDYVATQKYQPGLYYNGNFNNAHFPSHLLYCERVNQVRGVPALIKVGNNYYCGIATYDSTEDKYGFDFIRKIVRNDHPTIQDANVGLNSNNFDKNDVGQADSEGQPVQDAPSQTFTPQYTTNEGDTYNYYNETNNSTVNNFYNNYINNYTTNTNNEYNSTIINNNTGGGGSDPDDPEDPDQPSGGTTPPWDNSSGAGTLTPDGNGGYTFNLPDLTIPDLNIDWNLRGLSEKFPFSIPWDLMAFFTVLNAEPETPAIEAQIDLGIVDWDIDWDLHNFDTLAALLRNLEFIGFCLALILITRSIIKG